VLAPPQVEPGAGDALWSNLAGLLRQHRFPDPPAHVSFEFHWTVAGVVVGLWVPGTVAPHVVERAAEAAWPGARPNLAAPTPTLPEDADTKVVGGGLRLAGGPWQPLRTDHWADPLRALLGAAGELAAGETAGVQLLAPPAPRPRARRRGGPGGPAAGEPAVDQTLPRPGPSRRLRQATRAAHALAGVPHRRT